ncbi:hypothetical protein QYM36_000714 [Artemia franciscana]|uniref:Reverse transcriptase domain-containing protein n=1 Tax=Artemia franciscana TaxID=6661 RepID=A0AA88IGI7_ARTSF|nr:hypothetical protein QYM36_000714 [Artemia franciscana]
MKIETFGQISLTVDQNLRKALQTYPFFATRAPTGDPTITALELQQLSFSVAAQYYLIIVGDFNARDVLFDTYTQVLGKFGLGQICENGIRLVNYTLMNHLVVTNTMYQNKTNDLLSPHSNDNVFKTQIDFVLIPQPWRSLVIDFRFYNGAHTGSKSKSDHKLVLEKILFRLASWRKNKPRARIDMVEFGVKQGYVLSPTLFNYCTERVLEKALSSHPGFQIGQNFSLGDLEYADDVGIISDSEKAQTMLDEVVNWAHHISLKVSTVKTKFMAINHTDPMSLTVNQVQLDQV